jgi:hypothetical protein
MINLSALPLYNIFDCIEKTLATMNQDLLHNQSPYVSTTDLVRAKRVLFTEKERIQTIFDESYQRNDSSTDSKQPYILLKRADRYIVCSDDMSLVER